MKRKILKFAAIALMLAGTVACQNEDKAKDVELFAKEFLMRLESLTFQEKSENEAFPEWLLSMIEIIESNSPTVSNTKIYRGEWEKQNVYLASNALNSCILCDVYYEDGNRVILQDENSINEFYLQSKKWVIVYKYGA
jgi:hypothetical protein